MHLLAVVQILAAHALGNSVLKKRNNRKFRKKVKRKHYLTSSDLLLEAVELVNVKGCLLRHDACKTTYRACQ